jgi:hypothetical protein
VLGRCCVSLFVVRCDLVSRVVLNCGEGNDGKKFVEKETSMFTRDCVGSFFFCVLYSEANSEEIRERACEVEALSLTNLDIYTRLPFSS